MIKPRLVLLGIVVAYALLGLVVLSPAAVYSGDIGVKFVQARSLAANGFASLNLAYPGEFLDPSREFFPLRPPFILAAGAETQSIFSPASALINAAAVSVAGITGMTIVSLLAAAVVLYCTMKLAEPRLRPAILLALGVGSPLWFYAISGWEHAPAMALSTAAFAVAVVSRRRRAMVAAGLLLGAGAALRDEVLLLLPGLLLMMWLRQRSRTAVAAGLLGTAAAVMATAAVDVVWFSRPVAAHLRSAVHLLPRAGQLTDAPDAEVPTAAPFTLRQRYETVVQYWMLGYGKDRWIAAYAAGFLAALVWRWRFNSSAGILIWLFAVLGLAARDFWELLTAPKWLAGLQRVSPYLVFALLPGAASVARSHWMPAAAVFTTLVYLVVAFAGVDTAGGKSLGPRLLLPLFPLMTVAAIQRIDEYLDGRALERAVGRLGALLVIMAVGMHVCGTIRAYHGRNADDSRTLRALARTPERVVVSDDPFTAQLLFAMYYRKTIFLADTPQLGARLGPVLAAHRIPAVVLITRELGTDVTLPPYERHWTEHQGRMRIEHWRR